MNDSKDVEQGDGDDGLIIHSKFLPQIKRFDNADRLSFPDVNVLVPELGTPLRLHRMVLSEASEMLAKKLAELPSCKPCLYCVYDPEKVTIEWKKREADQCDEQYPSVMTKWLRFCYGEDQYFSRQQCVAALAICVQLEVKQAGIRQELEGFILQLAKSDIVVGAGLLRSCGRYPEICDESNRMFRELMTLVFTRENLINRYDVVVDGCLIHLPPFCLNYAEYGDRQTPFSEFLVRMRYIKYHCTMSVEQKKMVMNQCNMIDRNELEQLKTLGLINQENMIVLLQRMLSTAEETLNAQKKTFEASVQPFRSLCEDTMQSLGLCQFNMSDSLSMDRDERLFHLYERGQELGLMFAVNNLGMCYMKGQGVKRDVDKATELFKSAASMGCSNSLNNLAVCSDENNVPRKKKSFEPTEEWYEKAIALNNPYAMVNYGKCLLHGLHMEKNSAKAVQLFKRASELGVASGFFNLGVCFERGEGVEKNQEKATELFKKAASMGDIRAKARLLKMKPGVVTIIESDDQYDDAMMICTNTCRLTVSLFATKWSETCQSFRQSFYQIASQFRQVYFLDVDPDLCVLVKEKVTMVPTCILSIGNTEVGHVSGANPLMLQELISSTLSGTSSSVVVKSEPPPRTKIVDDIVEMGFPEEQVRDAISFVGEDTNSIIDWLTAEGRSDQL